MVLRVNGNVKPGAAQTGKGERVTLWLAHHVAATGVNATRAELLAEKILPSATLSGSNTITINGVTYSADAAYDAAYYAQKNLTTLVNAFASKAVVVNVKVSSAIATTTSPTADTATALISGADKFGTEVVESNGLVWKVVLDFEQKGNFIRPTAHPQGGLTLGPTTVADIHTFLEGMKLNATVVKASGGDRENMDDVFTTAAAPAGYASGTNFTPVTIVSAGNAAQATSQSVVVELDIDPDLA